MKAGAIKLNDFLELPKTRFIIPVYQRNYDWTHLQCAQLLNDIERVGNDKTVNSHFIGSIVFIHDDVYSTAKIRELTIIDGQQRIMTITLIWLVLYFLAEKLGDEERKEEIYETYLVNKFVKSEKKLKLRTTINNERALKHLMRGGNDNDFNEFSRLIDNFSYFKSKINENNMEFVVEGLSKLMFVEISLDRNNDDPQRIFESLNSTGLDLSQADLIRNYILMKLKHEDQDRIYTNYWELIEQLATEDNSNRNRVSDFIRDFITNEKKEIPAKGKVYQSFKSEYSFNNLEELENLLGKMKKYAGYYNKLINPNQEEDKDIRAQLKLINKLEINVSYPFLLKVYNDYAEKVINKEIFIEILDLLQSFVWRRFVVSLPTNALNKIFMRLYEDVDTSDYLVSVQKSLIKKKGSQRFPKDLEVIGALKEKDVYAISTKNRNYLFERLENFENREPVAIEGNDNITIEHIFPQNPNREWEKELGSDMCLEIKEKYLNTIANLTLSGNNGALGNRAFCTKRDESEKGYKDSRLFLNKYLSSLDKWDIDAIEKRFEILVERFKKIWKYPHTIAENADKDEGGEANIFEIDDPTGKKIEYAMLFDKKLEKLNFLELYREVISALFDLEQKIFFTTDLGERLKLTKDKSTLRDPLKINELYFINNINDSKGKFSKIKEALIAFECVDDLYIKFKD